MSLASYIAESFPLTGRAAMVANFIAYEASAKPLSQVAKEELIEKLKIKRSQHKAVLEDQQKLEALTRDELKAYVRMKKRAA